jgi:hypothetical protein
MKTLLAGQQQHEVNKEIERFSISIQQPRLLLKPRRFLKPSWFIGTFVFIFGFGF